MKSNSIYLLILIVLVSCDDEFLDLPPISAASVDELYQTDNDFQDAVVGIYSILRDQYSNFWHFELPSDDVRHQWPTEDIRLRMDNYTFQDNESLFHNTWINYYQMIFRANLVLERIEDVDEIAVPNRNRHLGEARFLRAFAYFDLVRIFGEVPLITSVLTNEEALERGRESTDRVYNEVIIPDLEAAFELLPESYPSSEVGRVTKGAAKSILGRVYLTLGDFQNASSVLQEVTSMGYSLLNDYNDLWDYSNEHHSEYIFDIEYQDGVLAGSPFTNNFSPNDPNVLDHYGVFGGAGNTYTPSDQLFEIFEEGDIRIEVTARRGIVDEEGNYIPMSGQVGASSFNAKYMTPIERGGDSPANWKVIRYADVLLMLAEALNEIGNTEEAHTYMNIVRERAGVDPYENLSQDEFREMIYLERRLELSFEGHRWFDLVRTGRAYETLQPLGMQSHMVLFPVPLNEVQIMNNPSIFPQNSGYAGN
jgi:starch-binding outer membrane protein, SusD/RagB family